MFFDTQLLHMMLDHHRKFQMYMFNVIDFIEVRVHASHVCLDAAGTLGFDGKNCSLLPDTFGCGD